MERRHGVWARHGDGCQKPGARDDAVQSLEMAAPSCSQGPTVSRSCLLAGHQCGAGGNRHTGAQRLLIPEELAPLRTSSGEQLPKDMRVVGWCGEEESSVKTSAGLSPRRKD